jgi:hypothetical protein
LYYSNKFHAAEGNIKKTWQVIKGVINPTAKGKPIIKEIKIDNNVITNPQAIAHKFNDFFTNIGPQLASRIQSVPGDPLPFIQENYPNSMTIFDTDRNEIVKATHSLKALSSKGHDDISPVVIKNIIGGLSTPLCSTFYLSFQMGHLPDQLKIARVVPIHKADDVLSANNYKTNLGFTISIKSPRKTNAQSSA